MHLGSLLYIFTTDKISQIKTEVLVSVEEDMVNQVEYEVYAYHHKKKLLREAEVSRMLSRRDKQSSAVETGNQSLITWLIKLLSQQNTRQGAGYRNEFGSKRSQFTG